MQAKLFGNGRPAGSDPYSNLRANAGHERTGYLREMMRADAILYDGRLVDLARSESLANPCVMAGDDSEISGSGLCRRATGIAHDDCRCRPKNPQQTAAHPRPTSGLLPRMRSKAFVRSLARAAAIEDYGRSHCDPEGKHESGNLRSI
jgi:hypothetical protein